jgi:hypothetical protein
VYEHLRQVHRGVRGGSTNPPLGGCRGAKPFAMGFKGNTPEIFFRTGTTYFRDHMIFRWFFHQMVFCRCFSISG